VYFDSVFRPSGFGIGIDGETARSLQLGADGTPCLAGPPAPGAILSLDPAAPAALLAKCADSPGVNYKGGNPWKEIGTWTTSLPGDGGFAEGAPERLRGPWRRP
jgi:hypothetical protein